MKRILYSIACIAIISTGCSDGLGENKEVKVLNAQKYTKTISLSRAESTENDAINTFAMDLFAKGLAESACWDDNDNFSLSPLSASLCLGMIANSSDDETAAKIVNAMGCSSLEDMTSTCTKLMNYLPHADNGGTLYLANSIWVDDAYSLLDSYTSKMNSAFNADIYSFDFSRSDMADLMNYWCAKKTDNLISQVVKNVSPANIAYLFNAMYFAAKWKTPFDKNKTANGTFYGSKRTSTVKNMTVKDSFTTYVADDCEAVQLPFKNEKADMIFILPNKDVDIYEFSAGFDAAKFDYVMSKKYGQSSLNVVLPIFCLEQNYAMNTIFRNIGMDIQELSFAKAGIPGMQTSVTTQSNYVSIDETGAKAASVTSTTLLTSVNEGLLNFDRPFIFVIRNNVTGSIIMAGRVCNL